VFAFALALTGPLRVEQSLRAAVLLAVSVAVLISLAGLRFEAARQFLDDPSALVIAGVLVLFAMPFVCLLLSVRTRVFDYAALFDTSWAIVVRYLAGWLFVGAFWAVVFLSNGLLELVGIDVIDALFGIDWLRFALSGAMLGLGLAVAHEFRAYVSPLLILRLLRLLLPIFLAVVVVFLLALPLRGLTQLFGDFSSAATLMAVAIAAISLISIALDRDDRAGINTFGMKLAARALALIVPVIAGFALWAVVLRVQQYGWTPERVLAATCASVLFVYGVSYGFAAVSGRGWRTAIRRANVRMAVLVLAVAALWLTPVLYPERIAAQSQLARFLDGAASADQLPLWELSREWGFAGEQVHATLIREAQARDETLLRDRLAALDQSSTRFEFERSLADLRAAGDVGTLLPLIAVRPEGALALTEAMFADVPEFRLTRWQQGCARVDEDMPRCVWISGPFLPGIAAENQAIFLFSGDGDRVSAVHVTLHNDEVSDRVRAIFDVNAAVWAELTSDDLARAADGDFDIVPSGVFGLTLGDATLVPGN